MSFGFGSNSSQSGGFGGFGSNTNTTSSGGMFGSSTATSGGGGFGGFGGAQNKPAFGSTNTSSGGLFGGGTSTSGGFGASTNNNTTNNTSGFGGFGSNNNNASGGSLFGSQNKPAGFGSNTGGSLFGGGANNSSTGGTFGSSNTTSFGGGAAGGGGGFGGFGSNTNNQPSNTSGGFGGFGSTNTAGGGFGASNNTTNTNNNQGTSATPFQAFQEKDTATNTNSAYQSLTFMPPYSGKSFEELRCEDYAQGRRYGNTNGQSGAFGQSTGFGSNTGGFGSTNNSTTNASGGLFGGANNTNTNNTTASGGFGGFGASNTQQPKPAFGGFGSTNTNTGGSLFGQSSSGTGSGGFGATAGSGGGLFGNQNSATGGFGASNTTSTPFGQQNNQPATSGFGSSNTGGGLFGNNNQQQQPKPAFGGFGSNTSNANTGGGLFGNNQQTQNSGGAFGSNTNTGGGLFGGNNNQQNQSKPAFGGFGQSNTGGGFGQSNTNTGGSLFGNNTQQQNSNPFGGTSANTGGSLFGNNTQQNNTSGSLFGGANKPATGGSLFGSNNNNTANTGGNSLFGGQSQNNNAGGSLFGNSTNTNTGGSLFGNNNTNKPAGGSLFGNMNQNNNAGNSLFGQSNQSNNAGNSLFGGMNNNNNNQNQQNSGASLFGSMNSNQGQQQNSLTTSLTSVPYGNEQLFSSLAAPSPPVGPLATPLNGAKPMSRKSNSLLASTRIGSPAYSTPRAGGSFGRSGYGFSYSTYGTPSSVSSFSGSLTPGAQSLLKPTGSLGSGLSQRLGLTKSASMNSLRGESSGGRPSLLNSAPNSGSIRRLKVDRSLNMDLFAPASSAPPTTIVDTEHATPGPGPSGLKKTVSFDRSATKEGNYASGSSQTGQDSNAVPSASNALVRAESPVEEAPRSNGALATVDEDATPQPRKTTSPTSGGTPVAGEYWSQPPIRTLKQMGRSQLQHVGQFTIGRDNVGRIEFHKPDLSTVDLDNMFDKTVILAKAHATVYPDNATKPKPGHGLNVPSTIWLQNVWPKKHKDAEALKGENIPKQVLEKHLRLLKKVTGTKFLAYDPKRGEWNFSVEHYTTYAFDEEDEDGTIQDTEHDISSPLSEAPETPGDILLDNDMTGQSFETRTSQEGPEEDTFQFKLERSRLSQSGRSSVRSPAVPGGFDEEQRNVTYDYDDPSADEAIDNDVDQDQSMMMGALVDMEDPFIASALDGGAVQAPSPDAMDRYRSSLMQEDDLIPAEEIDDHEVPGSFRKEPAPPKSILKPSAVAPPLFDEAWEEKLQRTVSPKKQARNRHELRDLQRSVLKPRTDEVSVVSPLKRSLFGQSMMGQSHFGHSHLASKSAIKSKFDQSMMGSKELYKSQAFKTSMDIMNSLWAQEKKPGRETGADKYTFPNKRARHSNPEHVTPEDAAILTTVPPSFAADGTLLFEATTAAPIPDDLTSPLMPVVGERKDIQFVKFSPADDVNPSNLSLQKKASHVAEERIMSHAFPPKHFSFAELARGITGSSDFETVEYRIWQLCSVLFDDLVTVASKYSVGMSTADVAKYQPRMRLDALKDLWADLTRPAVDEQLKRVKSAEEKALLMLTTNNIGAACEALVAGRNFKLATMIAQLPCAVDAQKVMAKQVQAWRERHDWSEMSDVVRALYSILAGECCYVEGSQNVAAEDQATSFCIAERFGLTWQQSLGLRLFCGSGEQIEDVVKPYSDDVASGKETTQPISRLGAGRLNDPLVQLLRISYVAKGDFSVADLLDPTTVSGRATNSRLVWQMATLLKSTSTINVPDQVVDKLTIDFASELDAAGFYTTAAWVLLHLSRPNDRRHAVQGLLDRNSAKIPSPADLKDDTASAERNDFDILVQENGIPEGLVWTSKALAAASIAQDAYLQTEFLLMAVPHGQLQAMEEAHTLLCNVVGPKAVIELDYDPLVSLIALFNKAMKTSPPDTWESGGQIYADFVALMQMNAREMRARKAITLLNRLSRGLMLMEEMRAGANTGSSLIERVARSEMKRVVDEALRELDGDAGLPANIGGGNMDPFMGEVFIEGAGMWRGYVDALGEVA